jgi:hypothetical protein
MSKVWLKCKAGERYGDDRLITAATAAGEPAVFFSPESEVVEDEHGAHVRVTYCGRRAGCILVAIQCTADLERTTFHLAAESDVMFSDTHGATAAALLPGRVTSLSRAEARNNYRAARTRYKQLRELFDGGGDGLAALDQLWFALESSVDPFIRWEVIAEEELAEESNGDHRRQ